MLTHYKNQSCGQLKSLLEGEKITFSVLISILDRQCTDIFTDHESIIICYSNPPFPVWVWCDDTGKIDDVAACLKEHFPYEKGYFHIMSAEVFEALQEYEYYRNIHIAVDMLSYKLTNLLPVSKKSPGKVVLAEPCDIDRLAQFLRDFELEAEGAEHEMSHCVSRIKEHISGGTLFTWVSEENEITAMAARIDTEGFSRISAVYTLPEHRRKGYALNLVHSLCENALRDSLTPILYADGSYGASNDCYKKIGFQLVGRLYHVRKKII